MTGRVLVRPRVSRDIAEIAGFIAADNLGASDRFIEAGYHAFELLGAMPHLGTARRFPTWHPERTSYLASAEI
jgi:plasmid stabilization system protein ParE